MYNLNTKGCYTINGLSKENNYTSGWWDLKHHQSVFTPASAAARSPTDNENNEKNSRIVTVRKDYQSVYTRYCIIRSQRSRIVRIIQQLKWRLDSAKRSWNSTRKHVTNKEAWQHRHHFLVDDFPRSTYVPRVEPSPVISWFVNPSNCRDIN